MNFNITERICTLVPYTVITDNADYEAIFTFDEEWNGKVKTARFENEHGLYSDVILNDDKCIIPIEILHARFLKVGVYTDKMTSTYCLINQRESIKFKNGTVPPPSEDIYAQLLTKIDSKQNHLTAGTNITIENDVISATGGSGNAVWGEITGDIENQHDLTDLLVEAGTIWSEESKAYTDGRVATKVTNDGNGVSGAMYQLDFNSNPITEDTQIVVQESDTKWVRRKADMIWQWLRAKIFSAFVSVNEQSLTSAQRIQARDNIKAAAGGQRRVTQDVSRIIDLTPYTSSANHYVCPCDGYLRLRGATSGRANASVDNYTSISALNDAYNMTFVAEGAWIFVSGNPQTAQFLPIELVEDQND